MKSQNFQAFLALTIVALALSACRPGDRNSKNELTKPIQYSLLADFQYEIHQLDSASAIFLGKQVDFQHFCHGRVL